MPYKKRDSNQQEASNKVRRHRIRARLNLLNFGQLKNT